MTDPKFPQLPFLTRDMLDFGSDASLELEVVSYSNATLPIEMVGLTREGVTKYEIKHVGDGTPQTDTFGIHNFPISLTLFTDNANFERGDFYASVYFKINGERVYKLCSGYVTKQSGINYPQTHDESEVGPHGLIRRIDITNPAAGAEWNQLVEANKRWRLQSVVATLTTDANVANRRVHLLMSNTTTSPAASIDCISAVDHAASTAKKYSCAGYGFITDGDQDDDILIPIPDQFWLMYPAKVQTVTENIQAGDQWSSVDLSVEEFIED